MYKRQRKGVTKEQAMRVKQLYEQQNNVNASNATGTDVNESRLREEMKENTSDMLEDHPSTQDLARSNQVFGRNIFNTRNLTFEPSVNLSLIHICMVTVHPDNRIRSIRTVRWSNDDRQLMQSPRPEYSTRDNLHIV